ncbi:MAG: hypothetical protein JNM72_21765 [Deltaproteobacteria bacterium]|nr:hypothetical protein [Deltaproteobacteria bacterium]
MTLPLLLLLAAPAFAQATGPAARGRDPADDLAGQPTGVGLGVALGEPSGIALSVRPKPEQAMNAVFGWGFVDGSLHLGLDYTRSVHTFEADSTPQLRYPVYLGVGASAQLGGASPGGAAASGGQGAAVGLRVPVGLMLQPTELRVDLAFEVAPRIDVLGGFGLGVEGAVLARYYLGPKAKPAEAPLGKVR